MILDHGVWMENIRTDLASPGDLAIITLQFIQTFFMLLLFQFQQLGFQQFHRCILVLVLGSFVLACHHDIGRQVGDPDSRIRLVDVLTTCPAGTERIDPQIIRIDLHIQILINFRDHI